MKMESEKIECGNLVAQKIGGKFRAKLAAITILREIYRIQIDWSPISSTMIFFAAVSLFVSACATSTIDPKVK